MTFGFDNAGLINASDPYGNTNRFFLDHRGLLAKVENAHGHTVRFAYDNRLNLSGIIDPAGRTHEYTYDATGNMVDAIDPLGNHTRFSYAGPQHRLAFLSDAKGNPTRYTHDEQGNLTAITYANSAVEAWAYDATGSPTTWTNRRGNPIQYEFNTNGHLTAKRYPDGSQAAYEYDGRGNLIAASNYTGRITLDYNAGDRLQRITYPGDRWLEYTYNVAGQRASMTDQFGYRLDYDYDAAGRLRSMTNPGGTRIVLYEYDAAGRLSGKTLANGVSTTYTYDRAGQLLTLANAKPDHTVLSFFNYTYDARGRRTGMATHYGAWTYDYDDSGQLTHAVLVSIDPQIPSQDLLYEYDSMGNRARTVENGVTTEYEVNNMNQYVSAGSAALSYDADGSLTEESSNETGITAFTNDFENRLTSVQSKDGTRRFDYNALGFPSSITRAGVESFQVHDASGIGYLVATYEETGALQQRQNNGFGLLNLEDGAGQSFSSFDGLGNLSDSTGDTATVLATHSFLPFGREVADGVAPTGFAGELAVRQEGELHLMSSRFYSTVLGRFVQPDPIGIRGGYNLYAFVDNQPTRFVDPTGFRWRDQDIRNSGMNPNAPIGPGSQVSNRDYYHFTDHLSDPLDWDGLVQRLAPEPSLEADGRIVRFDFPGPVEAAWETLQWAFQQVGPTPGEGGNGDPMDRSSGGGAGGGGGGGWGDGEGSVYHPSKVPLPPTDPIDSGSSGIPRARDPNEKLGPSGYGAPSTTFTPPACCPTPSTSRTKPTPPPQRSRCSSPTGSRTPWTGGRLS